jgi:hypothetical protein
MRTNRHYGTTARVKGAWCVAVVIGFLMIFSSIPASSEKVETPQSFTARKRSEYQEGLNKVKEAWRKFCVVAGKPVIPVGQEEGAGQPPGGPARVPGEPGGEYQIVETEGLEGFSSGYSFAEGFEIEQVVNSWYTSGPGGTTGTNPFSWVSVEGTFRTTGGGPGRPVGGDQCSGRSRVFDMAAPGGPYAGINLDASTQSCQLGGFSMTASTIFFNGLAGNYQYGPSPEQGWTCTNCGGFPAIGSYDAIYVKNFTKGTSSVGISFKVTQTQQGGRGGMVVYTLQVNSVNW